MKAALKRATSGRLGRMKQRSTKETVLISGDDVVLTTAPDRIQNYQVVGTTELGGATSLSAPNLRIVALESKVNELREQLATAEAKYQAKYHAVEAEHQAADAKHHEADSAVPSAKQQRTDVSEAIVTSPSPSALAPTFASDWRAANWLTSEGCATVLANALLGQHNGDELEAMRALGRSATLEKELLSRLVAATGPLATQLAPRLVQLATVEPATSGEMQTKFSQETRGMLEYANLNMFFGGLEALVGSPSPKVKEVMEQEHTASIDSEREFTTSNYGMCTTSAVEWVFVASPDSVPPGGFPMEEKLRALSKFDDALDLPAELAALRDSGARPRRPMPMADLEAAVKEHANDKLAKLGEPKMSTEEALGLRM